MAILLGSLMSTVHLPWRDGYVRQGGTLVVNSRQVNRPPECGLPRGDTTDRESRSDRGPRFVRGGRQRCLGRTLRLERLRICGAQPLWNDGKGHILASVNRFGRGRVVLTAADFMVPRQQRNLVASAAKMPLVELLMRQIVKEVLPIEVHGDIEYGVNKVSDGWWVYLINNKGVTKYTTTPEKVDVAKPPK